VQQFLEGESYVTISYVPQLLFMLHRQIENLSSMPGFEEVAATMMSVFEERFGDLSADTVFTRGIRRGKRRLRQGIPAIALLAAALDPRTKGLDYLRAENRNDIRSTILEIMVEEYQDDMDTKKSCYEKEVVKENDEQSGGKRRKVASNKSEGGEGEDIFSMLHTFSMDNKKVCK
jgi:hypothetical protein